ncbi:hypothetical protein M407DRAFT_29724 [Tulasnella calospora MUT 4182]|uniref:Uncharacterized protein n=1 Tax=Tulasnella calospora MUT 4182 TaxID=1051891 RepID=A0A0C3KGN9_9AGAM|nr:hypothetical protein M407DRAFT_29724 [Tulasnella calospora MUT 4182]
MTSVAELSIRAHRPVNKNISKVIYCIRALSHLLAREGLARWIGNLLGQLQFSDDRLTETQKGVDTELSNCGARRGDGHERGAGAGIREREALTLGRNVCSCSKSLRTWSTLGGSRRNPTILASTGLSIWSCQRSVYQRPPLEPRLRFWRPRVEKKKEEAVVVPTGAAVQQVDPQNNRQTLESASVQQRAWV